MIRSLVRSLQSKKVYEFRTYDIKPEFFPSFVELTNKHIHLRTKYSPLVGYWSTEIGGINQTVHIWEYNDLGERAAVRATLGGDSEWMGLYMDKIRPMLDKQNNTLLRQFTSWGNNKPIDGKCVYEIEQIHLKPGNLENWTNAYSKKISERKGEEGLLPYSVYFSEVGDLDTIVFLWRYTSWQERDLIKAKDLQNETGNPVEAFPYINSITSKIVTGLNFSPLK